VTRALALAAAVVVCADSAGWAHQPVRILMCDSVTGRHYPMYVSMRLRVFSTQSGPLRIQIDRPSIDPPRDDAGPWWAERIAP